MNLKTVGVIALAILGGCASEAKYKEVVSSYVGSSEANLVAQWGVPHSTYRADDGTKYLVYRRARTYTVDGTPPTYETRRTGAGTYSTTAVGGTDSVTLTGQCTTTFKVVDGTIRGASYKGNQCTA